MKGLTENAVFVAKERYFTVDLPVETVYGSGRGNMLVQGVIDLLIAYPNGDAVIVDYKTGDPRFFDIAAYAKQLELYKLATERTANYRVTHMYLYSFSANKLLEYPHFRID